MKIVFPARVSAREMVLVLVLVSVLALFLIFAFMCCGFFSVFCFSSSRRVKVEQLTGLNVGLVGVRASAGPTVGPKFA